jgi:hypothetical protein
MKQTTPTSINEEVLEFCKEITSSNEPFFVDVIPYEEAEYQECFSNVENYIKKFGGKLQQGWTIWSIPEKFIEAEFHAIWIDKNGKPLDISPKPYGEERILFLKDDEKKSNGEPVGNIRKVLLDTAEFRAMKIFGEEQFKIFRKYWDGSKMAIPEFEIITLRKLETEIFLSEIQKDKISGKIKIGRNELCPCGSGKKYKKCCLKI